MVINAMPLNYVVKMAEMNESSPRWGHRAWCFQPSMVMKPGFGHRLELRLCSTTY